MSVTSWSFCLVLVINIKGLAPIAVNKSELNPWSGMNCSWALRRSIIGNYTYIHTGCPKKNSDPRLNGHKGHQNWTNDKSRVSFEKFRKFPVWWAQKLLILSKNGREKWDQTWLPPLNNHNIWGPPVDSSSARNSMKYWSIHCFRRCNTNVVLSHTFNTTQFN